MPPERPHPGHGTGPLDRRPGAGDPGRDGLRPLVGARSVRTADAPRADHREHLSVGQRRARRAGAGGAAARGGPRRVGLPGRGRRHHGPVRHPAPPAAQPLPDVPGGRPAAGRTLRGGRAAGRRVDRGEVGPLADGLPRDRGGRRRRGGAGLPRPGRGVPAPGSRPRRPAHRAGPDRGRGAGAVPGPGGLRGQRGLPHQPPHRRVAGRPGAAAARHGPDGTPAGRPTGPRPSGRSRFPATPRCSRCRGGSRC